MLGFESFGVSFDVSVLMCPSKRGRGPTGKGCWGPFFNFRKIRRRENERGDETMTTTSRGVFFSFAFLFFLHFSLSYTLSFKKILTLLFSLQKSGLFLLENQTHQKKIKWLLKYTVKSRRRLC